MSQYDQCRRIQTKPLGWFPSNIILFAIIPPIYARWQQQRFLCCRWVLWAHFYPDLAEGQLQRMWFSNRAAEGSPLIYLCHEFEHPMLPHDECYCGCNHSLHNQCAALARMNPKHANSPWAEQASLVHRWQVPASKTARAFQKGKCCP